MTRVKLENSGEKYYTSYGPANNELKIYNSNHSVWKSIKLPTESAIEFDNINTVSSISESKINPDSLIEIVYTFSTGLLGLGSEYSSKIINENGEILAESGNYLLISEIIGLQNKIIGINHNFIYGSTGYVYSLGNLSTSNFSKNATVTLSPNPVVSFLNLSPISYPIIEATIYNLSGILVKKEIAQNITKINVSNLPMGLYIVNLTDLNNQKSYHKITVAH